MCAGVAVILGRRRRDASHRTAFWLGIAVLVPACGAVAITVVFVIGEVLSGG